MNTSIRVLGCEVFAVSPDPDQGERGDSITTPVEFTQTGPNLTDGRYGIDDRSTR